MRRNLSTVIAASLVVMVAGSAHAETRFAVQNTAGTIDNMVVTDNGYIGVGTTAPSAGIHVKNGAYPFNTLKAEGNELAGGGGFLGYHVKSDATLPVAGDRLGFMLFGTTNGPTAMHGAGFTAKADGPWTATTAPTSFLIETTGAYGLTRVERIRLSSNGNVGIGDFSAVAATQRLEVNGGVRLNTATARPACDANARGTFWYTKGGTLTADSLDLCFKSAVDAYSWVKIQ